MSEKEVTTIECDYGKPHTRYRFGLCNTDRTVYMYGGYADSAYADDFWKMECMYSSIILHI